MLSLSESTYLLDHMKEEFENNIKTIDMIRDGLEIRKKIVITDKDRFLVIIQGRLDQLQEYSDEYPVKRMLRSLMEEIEGG